MDNQINHSSQEELIALREQLTTLRGHWKATVAITARQEVIVNQIRTQLYTFDNNTTDSSQTRNWDQQHGSLAMEKDKLNDIAEQQNGVTNQARMIEARVNQLASRAEQQETASHASQSDDVDLEKDLYATLYDAEDTSKDEEPNTKDFLSFQLTQSQQQFNDLTEKHNTLNAKNLLSFKRCAILSRENQLIDNQNFTLRTERNVLQSRLDALEDQGIDIGEPRNDAEAEARVSRRKHRNKRVYEGLAGAKIFPAQEEAHDDVILETELLDATDQIVGVGVVPPLLSPKEKHAIDMLFEEDSDNTKEKDIEQAVNAPATQQFKFGSYIDNDMVYEHSEDLIDWTQDDDEYQFCSYPPVALPAVNPPFSALHTGESQASKGWQDNGESFNNLDQEEIYRTQRDAALAELEQPWEDLSRPLSPRSLPPYLPPSSPRCEEKLGQLQAETNAVKEELHQARGDLETLRRNFATKSAEAKGARLRIKVLEEEIEERETKEQQLREELRLGREEDPLADKLFVELNRMRRELEAFEEKKLGEKGKLSEVQAEYEGYKAKMEAHIQELKYQIADAENAKREATARVTTLEEAAEKGNACVSELEQKIVAGNGQLNYLTDTLWAREEEIKVQNAELETLTQKLKLEPHNPETFQDLKEALNAKEQEINRLAAELETQTWKFERARSDFQGCNSSSQKLKTELENAETVVKQLTAQLNEAIGERDQARNGARHAVAAAEKAGDGVVESRRELGASNIMGKRLRSISSENIRELASVREERDITVYNVRKLERDLSSCRDEIQAVKAQLIEISNERDELVRENQNAVGRYVDAERTAEEHWKRVVEGITEIERLKRPVNEPNSPLAHIPSPRITPKRTKPTLKLKLTVKPKNKPAPSTNSVQSIRPSRLSRNPKPVYTDALSPGSPTLSLTTSTAPKRDRKRKRDVSEADVVDEEQRKTRRRK